MFSVKWFTPTGVGTIGQTRGAYQPRAVHPHGRGDNLWSVAHQRAMHGSPPRAWGQCWYAHLPPDAPRFTPTGVGTIALRFAALAPRAVHPHGRGDNYLQANRQWEYHGSPPRAWGQSIVSAGEDRNLRFTPTGVRTIRSPPDCAACMMVHPHGRGDNFQDVFPSFVLGGSPPRAWGQCIGVGARCGWLRFTPTGVGTISRKPEISSPVTVHPHGRGDNCCAGR